MNEKASVILGETYRGDTDVNKYLSFRLGKQIFGASILSVQEIIEYEEVTPVPMMPDFICGVINLRDHVVPVVDLAKRLGNEGVQVNRRTCIVIVEIYMDDTELEVGLIVDAVSDVVDLTDKEIEVTPSFGGKLRTDFIKSMAKCDGRLFILLDLQRLLSFDDFANLSEMGEFQLPLLELDDVTVP